MILILSTKDHRERAEVLQRNIPGSQALLCNSPPKKIQGLDTIIFWGHAGGAASFCDLSPTEFVDLIVAWRSLNSGVKNIETISCNLVHAWKDHMNVTSVDSYIGQVKIVGGKRIGDVKIKTMPTHTKGVGGFSILLWSKSTSTWAYLAAGAYLQSASKTPNKVADVADDRMLMSMADFFRYENFAELAQWNALSPQEKIKQAKEAVKPKERLNPNFVALHTDFKKLFPGSQLPTYLHIQSGRVDELRGILKNA